MTREEPISKILISESGDDQAFQEIIAAAVDFGYMTEIEIARVCGCLRPTVNRWRTGANSPHPAIRPPMFQALIAELLEGGKR